jgi:prepilin-type N-terminal cleavage/methylation domain-containing protein
MMKFNREEGLTLIELLITIAVIAIVAAISVPVITNVVSSSRDNAAASMAVQANAFIDKYEKSGQVTYVATTGVFTGAADLNGNGIYTDDNEVIETLVVDLTKFTVGGLLPVPVTNVLPVDSSATVISKTATVPVD